MRLPALRIRPWLLLALLLVVLASAQVAVAHQRLETVARHNALQREATRLGDEISRMNIELAMLTRPERLRSVAVGQLGMQAPKPMQVVSP